MGGIKYDFINDGDPFFFCNEQFVDLSSLRPKPNSTRYNLVTFRRGWSVRTLAIENFMLQLGKAFTERRFYFLTRRFSHFTRRNGIQFSGRRRLFLLKHETFYVLPLGYKGGNLRHFDRIP